MRAALRASSESPFAKSRGGLPLRLKALADGLAADSHTGAVAYFRGRVNEMMALVAQHFSGSVSGMRSASTDFEYGVYASGQARREQWSSAQFALELFGDLPLHEMIAESQLHFMFLLHSSVDGELAGHFRRTFADSSLQRREPQDLRP